MSNLREHWSSRLGFIFAAIGSAIGLGVLWKFPYTIGQNGGGLFLFAYFIFILIIGIPIFIAELHLGRGSQKAAISAFGFYAKEKAGWKIAGWFGVISSFLIMSFYSVIAGWGMSYILMSLGGFYHGLTSEEVADVFTNLSKSGSISTFWHFLFTLITMGIVLSGVRKGIEFWAKIMTKALFVILLLLLIYSMSLPGFKEAFRFIFYPDFGEFKFSSALEALGLAFFTLSLGQGIMISYGSYMRRTESLPKMAIIVAVSVIIVAILAALTIFPVVFSFGFKPQMGSGLIFQTLPYLFSKLPGALVISTIFFVLFVFTALTSSIPFIEVVATNLMELLHWSRKRAVLSVACAMFLFGIPSALAGSGTLFANWKSIYGINFLETIDNVVSTWIIPVGGLLTAIFVGWVMDRRVSRQEMMEGVKWQWIYKPWRFTIRYIVPLVILLIILQKSGLINFDGMFHKGDQYSLIEKVSAVIRD